MKNSTEQEINKTLQYLGDSVDIQVSPLFVDTVSNKISHLRTRRGIGYQSRAFYPVMVVLMVGLNLAVLIASMGDRKSVTGETVNQVGIIAGEYGISQSSYTTF